MEQPFLFLSELKLITLINLTSKKKHGTSWNWSLPLLHNPNRWN
jgi:hypothetical protein